MKKITFIIVLTIIFQFQLSANSDLIPQPLLPLQEKGRLATPSQNQPDTDDWWWPQMGSSIVGNWELSIGLHGWPNDHLWARNLQWRGMAYLGNAGIRANAVIRSNREFNAITPLALSPDELYVEHLGFYRHDRTEFSYSIKTGLMRYLRFPYPDIIAMFDQVPGTEDLQHPTIDTGYKGILLTTEYAHALGIGHHFTGIDWLFGTRSGTDIIENYLFYRNRLSFLDIELRTGTLAIRPEPLGSSDNGFSLYLGMFLGDYKIGFLYETIRTQPIYTGILVEFAPSPVTQVMGSLHMDYNRAPEGWVVQIPLLNGTWNTAAALPPNANPIGKVVAERTITYWQNGQGRNFYEHILSYEGDINNKNAKIVMEESPWYLRIESLVSPYNQFQTWDDMVTWEKHRQGPAQLAQRVTYLFF